MAALAALVAAAVAARSGEAFAVGRPQEPASLLSTRAAASLELSGLWVCDPNIRSLLAQPEASVSAGELMGKCRMTFKPAACDAARNILSRGPTVIQRLDELCGPEYTKPDNTAVRRNGRGYSATGSLSAGAAGVGTGFGPLDEGVQLPGGNIARALVGRTSFRGPDAPPTRRETNLDTTTRNKEGPPLASQRFSWERPTPGNSTAIDAAAEAVRVFNAAGLGGGHSPREGGDFYPLTAVTRSGNIINDTVNVTVSQGTNVSYPAPVSDENLASKAAVNATHTFLNLNKPYIWNGRPGKWLPPGISVYRLPGYDGLQVCQDTKGWSNDAARLGAHVGVHPKDRDEGVFEFSGPKPGWTCKAYSSDYWAWCSDGRILEQGATGATFNNPEIHCCDCGGGTRWETTSSAMQTIASGALAVGGAALDGTVSGAALHETSIPAASAEAASVWAAALPSAAAAASVSGAPPEAASVSGVALPPVAATVASGDGLAASGLGPLMQAALAAAASDSTERPQTAALLELHALRGGSPLPLGARRQTLS